MNKYFLIAMIAFQMPIYGQTLEKEMFVVYEEVINELQSTVNIEALENKYDFIYLLLLDSSKLELFEKIGYPYIEEFRLYAPGLSLSTQTVGFVTDKKEIKEVFQDQNSLKRILDCTQPYNSRDIRMIELNYPIYIKGNKAIFIISKSNWSGTYSAILHNGVLQINWLAAIMEHPIIFDR